MKCSLTNVNIVSNLLPEGFLNLRQDGLSCRKSFALIYFFPFRREFKRPTKQPNDEMMDTSQQNADVEEQSSDRTEDEIEVIEITISSSEPEYTPQKQPDPEVTTPERLGVAQIKREAESILF